MCDYQINRNMLASDYMYYDTLCVTLSSLVVYIFLVFISTNFFHINHRSYCIENGFFMSKLLYLFIRTIGSDVSVSSITRFIQLTFGFVCVHGKSKWRENLLNNIHWTVNTLTDFFFILPTYPSNQFYYLDLCRFCFHFFMYVIPSALVDKIKFQFCECRDRLGEAVLCFVKSED